MAEIRDHYLEVDSLLSGELPSAIVQSFAGRNLETEFAVPEGAEPGWMKQKIQNKRNSIENVMGNGVTDLNEAEQGEGSRLIPEDLEEREARRERIARLALNSTSVNQRRPCGARAKTGFNSQHDRQYLASGRQSGRRTLLRFDIAHRLARRLRTRLIEYFHHPWDELGNRCTDRQAQGPSSFRVRVRASVCYNPLADWA